MGPSTSRGRILDYNDETLCNFSRYAVTIHCSASCSLCLGAGHVLFCLTALFVRTKILNISTPEVGEHSGDVGVNACAEYTLDPLDTASVRCVVHHFTQVLYSLSQVTSSESDSLVFVAVLFVLLGAPSC